MARWAQVEASAPEHAARARERFDAHRHKVLATLRPDGAPRLSGIEVTFADGDVWLGMMGGSLKARDLQRDPRLAVHSATVDPPSGAPGAWEGDAKLSGRAVEVTEPQEVARFLAATGAEPDDHVQGMHLFRVDVDQVVTVVVGEPADHLVIEVWDGGGLRRIERR